MRHRINPKVLALIIEGLLLLTGIIVMSILDRTGIKVPVLPFVIITGLLIFAFLLTLSLLKNDLLRENRKTFKESNLPLYYDNTTLMGHDIKDEEDVNNIKKH